MEHYEMIKALHLISIFIWISMLVYLPKLISFRLVALKSGNISLIEKIKKEEKTIYRYVASPAFVLAVGLGISLVMLNKDLLSTGFWIYIKFFFISILAIIHHWCKIYMLELDKNKTDINEKVFDYLSSTTLLLISVIILVTLVKMI